VDGAPAGSGTTRTRTESLVSTIVRASSPSGESGLPPVGAIETSALPTVIAPGASG